MGKKIGLGCFGLGLVAVLAVAAFGVSAYNGLVSLDQAVQAQWAQVENVYQRRADLVPNLVETVKGYASHEKDTLERVVQARSAAMSAQGPAAKAEAEGALAGALKSLFALSEAYPQLQAAGGFRDLQGALSEIEEQVAQARRYYNAVVRDFNTKTETFPSVLIARAFGFVKREFFEVAEGEKAVPKVKFD